MGSFRPPLSLPAVPKLLMELYGIQVKVVKELESYDDRNVLVEIEDNSSIPSHIIATKVLNGHPARFLFKVHHEMYSAHQDKLELRNAIITHLTKAGYPTPCLVHTLQGNYQTLIKLKDTETGKEGHHVAKLFEFLPGVTLSKICLTRFLCHQVGKLAGWMDAILLNFPCSEYKGIEKLKVHWNLAELSQVRTKLNFVKDKSTISLLEEVITKFETTVLNSQDCFSIGVIHSDLNDDNALVEKAMNNAACVKGITSCQECVDGSYKVSGVIDFGDMTYSFHIFELAIVMTYLMLNKGVKPLEAAASALSGYLEHMTLPSNEFKHLHICVCARLVQSFVYGEVALATDENNAEYTQNHASRCIPMLEYLWKFSDTEFVNLLIKNKMME